jgi:hypothetical protein
MSAAHKAHAEITTQSSRLLPALFSRLDPTRRITVLEVGPAVPETVRFFGQFRSRLHICDLFEEPLVREQQDELEEAEIKQAFLDLMQLPRGKLIDICLFWDFLNYLKPKTLRALNSALRPYLHPGTRGHGFSVLNVETPLSNRQYGIVQPDTLCSRPGRLAQLDYFPHSHEELNACLSAFRIGRGWLLADGRLEMQLEAQV